MAAWELANNGGEVTSSVLSRIKSYREKCLESQSKSQAQPTRRVSFPISDSYLESIKLSKDKKPIDIQVLRMGKFRHPWWGVMTFNEETFNSFIKNFETGIPQSELAFDFRHNPDWGAAGWMEKLFIDKLSLMSSTALTDRGREKIKKKEFKFFSVEFTEDYIEY